MKKPRNPIAMNMTEDTLNRACAVLAVLQNQQLTNEVMREDVAFGIDLILDTAIAALEYESGKIREAGRGS